MSRPKYPHPVKLVASIIAGDTALMNRAIMRLSQALGNCDYISSPIAFDYTDYYREEMGPALKRRFVAFEHLIRAETLPDVKLFTNDLETELAQGDNRTVNIDPGYLSEAHLILATGKAYTHRPYLRDGIYADLTLIYRGGAFRSLAWTYPDYAGAVVRHVLTHIRQKYLLQLKRLREQSDSSTTNEV